MVFKKTKELNDTIVSCIETTHPMKKVCVHRIKMVAVFFHELFAPGPSNTLTPFYPHKPTKKAVCKCAECM